MAATLLAWLPGAGGCADPEPEVVDLPSIEISGSSGLEIGQTLQLTAETVGDTDSSYTWASMNESVATVSADGVVTGVAAGETTITATGADTELVGTHPIVVFGTAPADVPGDTEPDVPDDVTVDAGPDLPSVPNLEKWQSSGHADKTAEAFNHWNEEDPPQVPTTCAKCHSTPGYRDYIGEDGSAFGSVESPAPVGTTVECTACHNDAADELSTVIFPSGVEVTGLGNEARCMTCHQGRASTDSVNEFIAGAEVAGPDAVDEDLNFQNIHYYAAGATLYAGKVRGGYQYDGNVYDWRFRHVPGLDTCVGCHDPHSLEVRVDVCSDCHDGVSDTEDLKDIRMMSSLSVDYDGDGDMTEGIYYEMVGLRDKLYSAIQDYTDGQGLGVICYSAAHYPYWFVDTNADGTCGEDEATFSNQYKQWTARLLRAAYNYQVALKDPGAFAHNAKYIIQLLHDSLQDLNTQITPPLDLSALDRNDPGHFNGAAEPARHWDEDDSVSASCSKCHGGSEGIDFYLEYGVGKEVLEQDNGLDCATCHTSFGDEFAVRDVADVTFPNGNTMSLGNGVTNLCATCHSGRESGASVQARIDAGNPSFRNIHYLPAGATRAGADAAVGYEYELNTYAGQATGHPGGDDCASCHRPVQTEHSFDVADAFDGTCTNCHTSATSLEDIRGVARTFDYDGDGSATEPLAGELEGLADALLTQMQMIASANGTPICYGAGSYPYWFADTNDDGSCDPSEATYSNSFGDWTDGLSKAAFNYQFWHVEPGAWAHNFDYMAQLLYDSIEDLGGDVGSLVRP